MIWETKKGVHIIRDYTIPEVSSKITLGCPGSEGFTFSL